MKQRILLIDTSAVLHTVKFSLIKQKISPREKSTFIIFGFLSKLQFLINKTRPNVLVFATDSKKSRRKKIYPSYKENRSQNNKTKEQITLDKLAFPQFEQVIDDVLPGLGFNNIFKANGLEADDIIAKICKEHSNSEIIIVSRDGDLYQLLTPSVCMLYPKNNQYYTYRMFIKEYKIKPKAWGRVKCVAGCLSDSVGGVSGVGIVRAIQYLKGELPKNYKTYQNIINKEGKKIIKRNKRLVILPFKGTPSFRIRQDNVSKNKIINIAEEYGFASILADLDSWAKSFGAY